MYRQLANSRVLLVACSTRLSPPVYEYLEIWYQKYALDFNFLPNLRSLTSRSPYVTAQITVPTFRVAFPVLLSEPGLYIRYTDLLRVGPGFESRVV